jgi:hypothetical protein
MFLSRQRWSRCLLAISFLVFFCAFVSQIGFTQDDAIHVLSGIVKHVDRGAKTVVVKADDGTEHTIKWTGKTSWEGTKDAGKGIKEGSHVGVKYTEKAGDKTAVGIKDLGKAAD